MVAVLGGTILETSLESAILSRFVPLDAKKDTLLLSDEGPLSSFWAKIHLAFALGLINRQIRDELDAIRIVRNSFAHSLMKMTFNTKAVRDVCNDLTQYWKLTIAGGGGARKPKDRYIASVIYITKVLKSQITAKPYSAAYLTPNSSWVPGPMPRS